MRELTYRVLTSACNFEPRGLPLAITRSTLAFAELITILFTADHDLFTYEPGLPEGMRCYGAHAVSLWCAVGPSPTGLFISRVTAIVVLTVAASGYRPRWTCIPQWFVTWSLATSMTLPSGGDEAALVATMLLIPVVLGDRRVWHWTRPEEPLGAVWAGSSYAAWCAIRCQIAIIYFVAALSKLFTSQWRDGTAMYSVFVDPNYGLPPGIRQFLGPMIASDLVVRSLTWGVLAIELTIALSALAPQRARRTAGWLAVLLHGGIMVAIGLFSFGLAMMALVLSLRIGDHESLTHPRSGARTGQTRPDVFYHALRLPAPRSPSSPPNDPPPALEPR
ncbi:sporulation-delaying protein SdpB family protein [Kitasatospora cineracea]